jgi:hypothetical protein
MHALSAGLKALTYNNAHKFAQSNRLCCGGHGYSMSSGLPQIIQETDGGCTYEGDNVVLLLQTARYLLKCAQRGQSPHLELDDIKTSKASANDQLIGEHFKPYLNVYASLYDQ